MPFLCLAHAAKLSRILTAALMLASITFCLAVSTHAQTETTLYNFAFGKNAPGSPPSGPVFDKAGNLYGVSTSGGLGYYGVIYKLTPVSGGWRESVIFNFGGGVGGGYPYATPIFDKAGNLYGTASVGGNLSTSACGPYGCGVVYKLSPTASGEWKQTVLYTFTGGKDGAAPTLGNLVFDKAGNLYGSNVGGANVTSQACSNTSGCGVIFQLSPVAGGKWNFNLLHTFSGGWDGVGPAFLTFNANGTLFGSAAGAWSGFELPSEPGLVFELTPTTSGPWKDSVIYSFGGSTDGGLPSGVIFDKAGNMYGTGADGGIMDNCWSGYGPMGCGVVFQLSPQSNGKWKETALYAFTDGSDGGQPDGGLVIDKGNLYGTTWGGGNPSSNGGNGGVVFELARNSDGTWTETVAHAFLGPDGAIPRSTLVADSTGNLYGTTVSGGTSGYGVVFELTP
jgi:uncharacterized repeat protein (TIGR03803 family)